MKTAAVEQGDVVALNHDGAGIVREGKTAFVAGALAGETVRFQRMRRHRQHDDARLVEVITPSARRVEPFCAHFGICGGCALQHLEPAAQIEAKQQELEENFARIARVAPEEWLAPLEGPARGYRRRARLGARYVIKKGRVVVGFRERLSPYVADLERCDVLMPPLDGLVTPLAELIMGLSIRERLPQIEVAQGDPLAGDERAGTAGGGVGAPSPTALVLRVLAEPSARDFERLRAFAAEHRIAFYLQRGGPDTVEPLDAPATLGYELPEFGLRLAFEPTDFIQVNGAVNRALVSRAVALLAPTPDDRVLDLYCGIGNFTLAIAQRAGEVVGVEGDEALVARARANALRNGVGNAAFHVGDLSSAPVPPPAWARRGFTQVLIDPPRVGAREVLPQVAAYAPRRIVYVACHPGSLARDVGLLVHEHGYVLRAAGVADMFPHTAHVESIAVLEPAHTRI